MGVCIAIANHKGGVGKTTIATNIAKALEKIFGKKVILVDLDPQANTTLTFSTLMDGRRNVTHVFKKAINYEDFKETIEESIRKVVTGGSENLYLLPSDIELDTLTMILGSKPDYVFITRSIVNYLRDSYDYILIDCPPRLDIITYSAFVASDFVIVPVQASYYPLHGTKDLLKVIDSVQEHYNPSLKVLGLVMTMKTNTNVSKDAEKIVRDKFGDKVFKTVISRSVKLEEAPSRKLSVFEYAPNSKSAKEIIELTKEIVERIEGG